MWKAGFLIGVMCVLTQHKVRLSGIDSPEKGQPFGQRCKQSLSDLAYGHTVAVESDKRDRLAA